jgi:hypothetical protein
MLRYRLRTLLIVADFLLMQGCGSDAGRHPSHALPVLHLDERYVQSIEFEVIGASIPIEQPGWYLRSDGVVPDVEAHQERLLTEVKVRPDKITYSNSAKYGREMTLKFDGGVRCAFIWVKEDTDPRINKIRLEHEKYHALARLNPEAVKSLSAAIRERGFDLDLEALEEELAASVVEILAFHIQGVELETIDGSEYVIQARDLLKHSRKRASIQ